MSITKKLFKVMVDDNSHYQDESERYTKGQYGSYEDAVKVCKSIVDAYLVEAYKQNMTAENLFSSYKSFGDDPWVSPVPDGITRFSAWEYARSRSHEICDAV